MSHENMNSEKMDTDTRAFDYVTGVMRGDERKAFEKIMHDNHAVREQVYFWEEELMALSNTDDVQTPDKKVWPAIERRIRTDPLQTHEPESLFTRWFKRLVWPTAGIATAALVLFLGISIAQKEIAAAHTNYVAVLTGEKGKPVLTVLTAMAGDTLSLKWETLNIPKDKNLQLWAVSRRDGQIRSLAVFAQVPGKPIALTDTHRHLIKDAESLLLTEEEIGGSPLDEPSDVVLAKGACVFMDNPAQTL